MSSFGALADNYTVRALITAMAQLVTAGLLSVRCKSKYFFKQRWCQYRFRLYAIAEGQYSSAIGSKTHAIGVHQWPLGLVQSLKVTGVSRWCIVVFIRPILNGPWSLFQSVGRLSIAMGDSSKADGANAIRWEMPLRLLVL